jgi:homocysteine S-methyltransferase
MGTVLYERGVFVNVCYDALSVQRPELVQAIHSEYVEAGAEILETNTFGANPVKLSAHGLDDRTEEINQAAARLALDAAGVDAWVLGAVGPLGVRIEPWGPTAVEEAREWFRRQMGALLDAGVHGLMLETFGDLGEMEVALTTARELTDRPVFAQLTVGSGGHTALGTEALSGAMRLQELGADVVGLNCSVGPAAMLDTVEELVEALEVPVVAQPNAGLPRTVGDRKMYLASPEYMARYGRRFVDLGVRFLGGCCGTTPEHIRLMAELIDGLEPRHPAARVGVPREHEAAVPPVPLSRRSTLGARLAEDDPEAEPEPILSVELLPPRGWDATALLEAARSVHEAGADFVSILDAPRGRSRMSALSLAGLVQRETGVETVMHYTCRGRAMMGMIADLLGAAADGVRNLLLVSGDPPVQGPYADAAAVVDIDSIGLTNVVAGLNQGVDPGGTTIGPPTPFVTGVAVNPGAVDRERELRRFRWKVEAGADYAVTQPLFDAQVLEDFLEDFLGARGRSPLPILAGLWPFSSLRNAEFLANEVPGVRVPESVLKRMEEAHARGEDAAAREAGLALSLEAAEGLKGRVRGFHISIPGGRVEHVLPLLGALRGRG